MDLKQDYLALFPFNLLCPYLKSVKIDAPERDKCKCERDRRVKRISPLCLRVWVGLHVVVVALALLSALENVQMNFLLVRDDER